MLGWNASHIKSKNDLTWMCDGKLHGFLKWVNYSKEISTLKLKPGMKKI